MNLLRFLPLFLTVLCLAGLSQQQTVLAQTSFTVTTTADAGAGSLRQAFANVTSSSSVGPFTITFGVSGTINVASTLTAPAESVILSGFSTNPDDVVLRGGGPTSDYAILFVPVSSTLTANYLTFTGGRINSAGGVGGAAITTSGILTVNRCVLWGNQATNGTDGGAIRQNNGLFRMSNSYLYNNRTDGSGAQGGAMFHAGGSFTITTSTFASNTATANGGAIQKTGTANGYIENCTFSNNVAAGGGAIEAAPGNLTITSSTFTLNRGTTSAGGIFGANGSEYVTLNNCLIAGNIAPTAPDLQSRFDSETGYNLIGNTAGSPVISAVTTGNVTGVSAATVLSATLANNGGPTMTHALFAGGPAYNAGPPSFSATADQRGIAVFNGRRDMGAYESQEFAPLVATVSSVSAAICDTNKGGFVLTVNGGNGAYQYKLTAAASFSTLPANPLTLTTVSPGSYTLSVRDGAGNTDNAVVTIAPASLTLTTLASQLSACANDIISLSVVAAGAGTYAYTWSGAGVGSPANTSVISATQTVGNGTQTYAVSVTGGTCTGSATVGVVTNPVMFTVTSLSNTGPGSLRQAFTDVENSPCPGSFSITFAVSGTITLSSGLSVPTQPLTLLGDPADPDAIVISGGGISSNYPILTMQSSRTLTVNNLTFANGRSSSPNGGGAIQNFGGKLNVNRCVFRNNRGSNNGGAILLDVASGQGIIRDSYFINNTATANGGAIYHSGGSFTITNSTFTSNTAGNGGAIGKTVINEAQIMNCTFFGNRASSSGGGIDAGFGSLTVLNSTVVSNTATSGGGIYGGDTGNRVTIGNCLIVGNTATSGPDLRAGFRSDTGHNLIGSLSGSPILDPVTTGNITGVSASTVVSLTLTDNGGSTPTLALLTGSPAINTGIGNDPDQRGLAVFGGRKDIGAFESQVPTPLVATAVSTTSAACSTNQGGFSFSAVGGTGNYQYRVSPSASFSPLTTNPLAITGVAPGSYTITVRDNLGNTDNISVTITLSSLTLTTTISPNPICIGSAISAAATATGNPTLTYAWSGAGISTSTTSRTITATPTNAGGVQAYTVVVTGGNCTAMATVSVTVLSPVVTITSLADAGPGSLRQAFANITASTCPGPFTITMGVSGTISVTSTLNVPDKSIVLVGFSTNPADVVLAGGGSSSNYSILNIPPPASLTLSYLTFTNGRNTTSGAGGGAIQSLGNLVINQCLFYNNRTSGAGVNGGAIRLNGGDLHISNSYLYNNVSSDAGGAIYDGGGSFTITTSTFDSNTATTNGGAIAKATANSGFIENCTFFGNRAVTGGGIEAAPGSLTITSNTFSRNRGTTSGGGIFGGNGANRVTINNCLIAGNISPSGPDLASSFRSDTGYNLIGDLAGPPTLDPITTGNITGVSATTTLSATLANNGGFTPTLALLSGSRAVNGGIGSGPDQRGLAVFGSAKDVGAFESQSPVIAVWTGATSTNWTTASNWQPAVVPGIDTQAILNSGSPRYPIINNTAPQAHSVQLNTGARITINAGGILTLTGGTSAVLTQGGQLINGGRLIFQ